MAQLTIGQVAKKSAVSVETIRFYERSGVIDAPPRSSGGYRQYSPDMVERIRFIQRARGLGFSLQEITELLALCENPGST